MANALRCKGRHRLADHLVELVDQQLHDLRACGQ